MCLLTTKEIKSAQITLKQTYPDLIFIKIYKLLRKRHDRFKWTHIPSFILILYDRICIVTLLITFKYSNKLHTINKNILIKCIIRNNENHDTSIQQAIHRQRQTYFTSAFKHIHKYYPKDVYTSYPFS